MDIIGRGRQQDTGTTFVSPKSATPVEKPENLCGTSLAGQSKFDFAGCICQRSRGSLAVNRRQFDGARTSFCAAHLFVRIFVCWYMLLGTSPGGIIAQLATVILTEVKGRLVAHRYLEDQLARRSQAGWPGSSECMGNLFYYLYLYNCVLRPRFSRW